MSFCYYQKKKHESLIKDNYAYTKGPGTARRRFKHFKIIHVILGHSDEVPKVLFSVGIFVLN